MFATRRLERNALVGRGNSNARWPPWGHRATRLRPQIHPEPALEAVLGRGTPEILESEGARTK